MSEDYLKVGNVSMNETKWESAMSGDSCVFSIANGGHITKGQIEAEIERRRLRDYFAGLAMQGLVTLYDAQSMNESIAHDAYMMADAMLKEREKEMTYKEKKIVTSKMPKTWHDVDKNIGKMVDKMSLEEKVDKGWANPSLLKNRKRK